jgi:predicted nicotinamide N-methyase
VDGPAPHTADERARFVAANTRPERTVLVPELELALVSELVPLWESTEQEMARRNLPPPFWAFAWAGGQAVARYVLDHPQVVAGRRVLDFASGSGIVGLAAARAGAAAVLCADLDPFAAAAAQHNAEANGLLLETTTEDLVGHLELDCEVVLAGDICYERPLAERVARWLHGLAAGGRTVLLGDPGRNFLPRTGLVPLAHYDVATTREIEDHDLRRTFVYAVPGDGAAARTGG